MTHRNVLVVLAVWLIAAFAVVAGGGLLRLQVPPPMIVIVLSTIVILVGLLFRDVRRWVLTVDIRAFLLVHLVRFVGIAFLILVSRGILAEAFTPIGWGDAIAATGAVLLLLMRVSPATPSGWTALMVWNTFGFADMVLLVVTGIRLGTVAPEQFTLFRELPFGLLPTFFVPLIIATHVFVFVRLLLRRRPV